MTSVLIIKRSIVVRFIFKRQIQRKEDPTSLLIFRFAFSQLILYFQYRHLVSEGVCVFRRSNFNRIAECMFHGIRLSKLTQTTKEKKNNEGSSASYCNIRLRSIKRVYANT